jgi:hypothetical protein
MKSGEPIMPQQKIKSSKIPKYFINALQQNILIYNIKQTFALNQNILL